MEPVTTFVVRIYRQAKGSLAGMVEEVRSGIRTPFVSAEQLWNALTRQKVKRDHSTKDSESH